MMIAVEFTEQEWTVVINLMAHAPARESVPWMNKIGAQLEKQKGNSQSIPATVPTNNLGDTDHGRGH